MENIIFLSYEDYIKLRVSIREAGIRMIVVHESKLTERMMAGWHALAGCNLDYSGGGTVTTYCMVKNS